MKNIQKVQNIINLEGLKIISIETSKEEDSKVFKFDLDGRELNVTVMLKEFQDAVKHNWESLVFADNSSTFATVEELNSKNSSTLVTNGEVRIVDEETQEELDIDTIIQLAKSDEIYDESKYFIDSNNWFSLDYYKDKELCEDDVIEAQPQSVEELAVLMVSWHIQYFEYVA